MADYISRPTNNSSESNSQGPSKLQLKLKEETSTTQEEISYSFGYLAESSPEEDDDTSKQEDHSHQDIDIVSRPMDSSTLGVGNQTKLQIRFQENPTKESSYSFGYDNTRDILATETSSSSDCEDEQLGNIYENTTFNASSEDEKQDVANKPILVQFNTPSRSRVSFDAQFETGSNLDTSKTITPTSRTQSQSFDAKFEMISSRASIEKLPSGRSYSSDYSSDDDMEDDHENDEHQETGIASVKSKIEDLKIELEASNQISQANMREVERLLEMNTFSEAQLAETNEELQVSKANILELTIELNKSNKNRLNQLNKTKQLAEEQAQEAESVIANLKIENNNLKCDLNSTIKSLKDNEINLTNEINSATRKFTCTVKSKDDENNCLKEEIDRLKCEHMKSEELSIKNIEELEYKNNNKIGELENEIGQVNEEVSRLKDEIKLKNEEGESKSLEIDNLIQKLKQLELTKNNLESTSLANTKKNAETLSKNCQEILKLNTQINNLSSSLRSNQDQLETLQEQYNNSQNLLSEIQGEKINLIAEIDSRKGLEIELKREIENLDIIVKELQVDKIEKQKAAGKEKEENLSIIKNELTNTIMELQTLQKDYDQLEESYNNCKIQKEQCQKDISNLTRQITIIQQDLENKNSDVDVIKSALVDKEKTIKNVNQILSKKKEELKITNKNLEVETEKVKSVSVNLDDATDRIKRLQLEMEDVKYNNQKLKSKEERLQSKISDLSAELETLGNLKNTLQDSLNNELINSEKLSKDNKKLNEKLLISESIVEAVSVSKKKIEFERDNFLKDFMQKEEKLIMMEEENSVLNGKVKVLRNQLENLKEDMQKTSAKNLGFRVYGFQQHNMHAYYGDIHCVHD